jgi:hypothetical protein
MSVPDKLKELAIILTARCWGAQFEDKVTAIAEGRHVGR